MKYITNSFSPKMISNIHNIHLTTQETTIEEIIENKNDCISAVGHHTIADKLGIPRNRMSIILEKGDELYIAQINPHTNVWSCMKIIAS